MNVFTTSRIFAVAGLLSIAGLLSAFSVIIGFAAGERNGAAQPARINVNGRVLSGMNSAAENRAGRYFLPVKTIARALGDTVEINAASRTLIVRRENGVTAEFDAESNQIRESGATTLKIQSSVDLVFPLTAAEMFLPIEIIAALFETAIRFDSDEQIFFISRGNFAATVSDTDMPGRKRGYLELYRLDYEAALSGYGTSANQNITASANGRIYDGRFSLSADFAGASFGHAGQSDFNFINFQRGTFSFERKGFQNLLLGDFGIGGDLQYLAANVRGVSASSTVRDVRLTVFAGAARSGFSAPVLIEPTALGLSGTAAPPILFFERRRVSFDEKVYGLTVRRDFKFASSPALVTTAGWVRYGSDARGGDIIAGNVRYSSEESSFTADGAISDYYTQNAANGKREKQRDGAVDFSAVWRLFDNFSIQARTAYVGENFSAPQARAREPIKLVAAGFNWQPVKWMSASLNANFAERTGTRAANNSVTAAVNINSGKTLPAIYFSHTENRSSISSKSSFTLVSVNRDFSRSRIFGNFTRSKIFNTDVFNWQIGARKAFDDKNAVEVAQSLSSGKSLNGFVEYQALNRFNSRLSFSAGAGYSASKSAELSVAGRFSLNLRLPKEMSVSANFSRTNAVNVFYVSLRGSLFKRKDADAVLNAPVSELLAYNSLTGRIYQDLNLNGIFDAGVDKPQSGVIVRANSSRIAQTDANGNYQIDNLKVGVHRVNLDLLTVRADLTILDSAERSIELGARRSAPLDFRLVRTGRVSGVVWMDKNENGKMDINETPVPDARVIAGVRDTLTDENGAFFLGDLPPGEYFILLDEKTLPDKWQSANSAPLKVKVTAGEESEIKMPVIFKPAQIKEF